MELLLETQEIFWDNYTIGFCIYERGVDLFVGWITTDDTNGIKEFMVCVNEIINVANIYRYNTTNYERLYFN